jgi:hypothetical protein
MEKIIYDIAVGLATALVILACKHYWSLIVSMFQQDIRRVARLLEQSWTGTETFSDDGSTDEFNMKLCCRGRQVSGNMICSGGPDKGREYDLKGSFDSLILSLIWTPKDAVALESGTITAKLVKDGKALEGHGVFYSPITEKIHTSTFAAIR